MYQYRTKQQSSSGNGNSAVSFTLCDDFTWEQGRHFSLQVASKTDPNALTVRFGQGDSLTKFLSRNIQQNDVSFVKYESDLEICFQSLVVDTTIIIDEPTTLLMTWPMRLRKSPKVQPNYFAKL